MKHQISINAGNNQACIVSGIRCKSPLERSRFCPKCGEISFLGGSCRKCGNQKCKPLVEVLQKEVNLESSHAIRSQLLALGLTLVLALLYMIYWVLLGGTAVLEDGSLSFIERFIMQASGALCMMSLGVQIVALIGSVKCSVTMKNGSYGVLGVAMYILAHGTCSLVIDGENIPWDKMMTAGYYRDIVYLQDIKLSYDESGASANYQDLYSKALCLSYVCDTKELAMLRLECLSKIRLENNAQTDLEQILGVLSQKVFWRDSSKIEHVFYCFKNTSGPYSGDMVRYLMRALSAVCDIQQYQKEIVDCLLMCGPYYVEPLLNQIDYFMLRPFYEEAMKNPVFQLQSRTMNGGGIYGES